MRIDTRMKKYGIHVVMSEVVSALRGEVHQSYMEGELKQSVLIREFKTTIHKATYALQVALLEIEVLKDS